jgi:hypothetical protein
MCFWGVATSLYFNGTPFPQHSILSFSFISIKNRRIIRRGFRIIAKQVLMLYCLYYNHIVKEVDSRADPDSSRVVESTSIGNRINQNETIVKNNDPNIHRQRTNGYYDSELETIVLGKSTNSGTLPHEFAHFWLEKVFNLTHGQDNIINDHFLSEKRECLCPVYVPDGLCVRVAECAALGFARGIIVDSRLPAPRPAEPPARQARLYS